jgi:hypothetical protein
MRRPTHAWKQNQHPTRVLSHVRKWKDDDHGHDGGEDLERDGVHVDRDVWSEESGSALVAVEEGWGDLQDFHDRGSILDAFWIGVDHCTILIRVSGRNIVRRDQQSLHKRNTKRDRKKERERERITEKDDGLIEWFTW